MWNESPTIDICKFHWEEALIMKQGLNEEDSHNYRRLMTWA